MNRQAKEAMLAGADAMWRAQELENSYARIDLQREIAALRWERFILWLALDCELYHAQYAAIGADTPFNQTGVAKFVRRKFQ